MSENPPEAAFGPYVFTLTAEEAQCAAARAGLRGALAGGLIARHLAPLAAFVLAILFTAILALTGFIPRRPAEAILLLAAAGFLTQRLIDRRRFFRLRRVAAKEIEAQRVAGPLTLIVGEAGLRLEGDAAPIHWEFADCIEAEDAGGLIYLWPRLGAPAIAPTRVFHDADEAARFTRHLKARLPRALAPPASGH
ncbi:MAG: hypothetical protein E7774_16840 [Bradyrhizobium sp.]|nr:MAG: hypothetical protein E7774_16840 [Bradyrhizobium sp.]